MLLRTIGSSTRDTLDGAGYTVNLLLRTGLALRYLPRRIRFTLDMAYGAGVRALPVTAIVAHDLEFWRHLVKLHPHEDRRDLFSGDPVKAETAAFRNATLQGAYLIIAARAMGYDVGAMSGFSNAKVDAEFFAGNSWRSNFLCNIGYADETALFQRLPRFTFEESCEII